MTRRQLPTMRTRESPSQATSRSPPRGEHWSARRQRPLPSCTLGSQPRDIQNGVSTECADPVTGSSSMPSHGAIKREQKSYSLESRVSRHVSRTATNSEPSCASRRAPALNEIDSNCSRVKPSSKRTSRYRTPGASSTSATGSSRLKACQKLKCSNCQNQDY